MGEIEWGREGEEGERRGRGIYTKSGPVEIIIGGGLLSTKGRTVADRGAHVSTGRDLRNLARGVMTLALIMVPSCTTYTPAIPALQIEIGLSHQNNL